MDVGCGSGMSTVNLFGKFSKILGKQSNNCKYLNNIENFKVLISVKL